MKKTLQIKNEIVRANAINLINIIPLDKLHEVIIRPFKRNRSLEQNALLWKWQTIIAEDLGYTKDELHAEYKSTILVPLMLKYPDDYPEFCEMVAAIQALRDADNEKEADNIAKKVIFFVTTTKLKVKHMTEYLNDIEKHAISLGIRLPALEYD